MHLDELLSPLLPDLLIARSHPHANPEIRSLEYHSQRVKEGSLFLAVRGLATNGHLFIEEALKRGAKSVASERKAPSGFSQPWIQVKAIRPCMARLAHHLHAYPSRKLKLVGITGTNGKTTTAFLIHSILMQQHPTLLMGTVKTILGARQLPVERTTPEAIDLQKTLAQAWAEGCRMGVMEVSSHALAFDRVLGTHFPLAVFTNLTPDHLDFHQTLERYFQSKQLLFQPDHNPGLECAVLNGDDRFSSRIRTPSNVLRMTFGWSRSNEVYPLGYSTSLKGSSLELSLSGRKLPLTSPLCGKHNLYNMMSAVTVCTALGIADEQIQAGMTALNCVPGRFEKVEINRAFTVIVDYAHTPDALRNVLKLCRKLSPARVLCLFGCGGDRDRMKRPLMGNIAVRGADWVIITSDNPRSEPAGKIVGDIQSGIPSGYRNCEVVTDRRAAITRVLHLAQEKDIVLLAGKGHETHQEISGEKIPFDDRQVVKEVL